MGPAIADGVGGADAAGRVVGGEREVPLLAFKTTIRCVYQPSHHLTSYPPLTPCIARIARTTACTAAAEGVLSVERSETLLACRDTRATTACLGQLPRYTPSQKPFNP